MGPTLAHYSGYIFSNARDFGEGARDQHVGHAVSIRGVFVHLLGGLTSAGFPLATTTTRPAKALFDGLFRENLGETLKGGTRVLGLGFERHCET